MLGPRRVITPERTKVLIRQLCVSLGAHRKWKVESYLKRSR